MRYAIFSDIHSNLEAFEAVLGAIGHDNVDEFCCAGDIVGYGADPAKCIEKTRLINPQIVAGNNDWGSAGLIDMQDFSQNAREAIKWTIGAISDADKNYLKNLRLARKEEFALVHGSLNRPEEFEYILSLAAAYTTFMLMEDLKICFVGHSHVAGVFERNASGHIEYHSLPEIKLKTGSKYIINAGSVGQPRDNDPRAAYCIYDSGANTINIKRVEYDIKTAQDKIIKAGLPRILAERLSLGK